MDRMEKQERGLGKMERGTSYALLNLRQRGQTVGSKGFLETIASYRRFLTF